MPFLLASITENCDHYYECFASNSRDKQLFVLDFPVRLSFRFKTLVYRLKYTIIQTLALIHSNMLPQGTRRCCLVGNKFSSILYSFLKF